MIKLISGDCITEMSHLEDESVDLIICDLPYGTTACDWDTLIDQHKLWEQYRRILKDTGTALMFGSEPFSTSIRNAAMDLYKYDWIWVKNNPSGFIHAKNKPMKNFEVISVFTKGTTMHAVQSDRRMTYNPQGLIKLEKPKKYEITEESRAKRKVLSNTEKIGTFESEYTNYPMMVIYFDNVPNKDMIQPTQKPVELYEYLIKTYSNEGETILDNCGGSGTLGVAAHNTNRNGIMIELEDQHVTNIKQRLHDNNIPFEMGETHTTPAIVVQAKSKGKNNTSQYITVDVELVKRLKKEGKSAYDIAETLGHKWVDISRSLSKRYKTPFNRM